MANDKSANSPQKPQVYKEEELEQMIELITNGVWRTTNLSNALHVDRKTIDVWKEFKEVKDAHRKAINKYSRKRTDTENVLKELGMEVDVSADSLIQINNYQQLTDEQLDKLIAAKGAEVGISPVIAGETTTDAGSATEVREATPETN